MTGTSQPAMYVDAVGFTKSKLLGYQQTTSSVYADALAGDWQDWSWDSTNNFNDTAYPYAGSKDIAWQANAGYAALSLHSSNGVNTTGYSAIMFGMQGSKTGQNVKVQLYDTNDSAIGSGVDISNYGGNPTTSGYTTYLIPLKDLGGNDRIIKRVNVQENTGNAQPVMYIDAIQLVKQATTYAYDNVGDLLSANYPDGTSVSYTYDNYGNRLTQTINGTQTTATYNNDNVMTANGGTSVTNDNNENRTGYGTKSYTYDFDNRLTNFSDSVSSTSAQYTYDGSGNRINKTVNSVSTQYVNDTQGTLSQVLMAKNMGTNSSQYYVYGVGLVSQGGPASSFQQYILDDGLGSNRFVTDNSGNVLGTYAYDPYGNQIYGDNTLSNYQFDKEQNNPESSMYYLRARYYDPSTGKFISKDPIEGSLMDPRSQNGFNYANNDPINLNDPSGQQAALAVPVAAACVVGGYAVATNPSVQHAFTEIVTGVVNGITTYLDKVVSNPAQDKKLSQGEIDKLKNAGVDPESLKEGIGSKGDLFKRPDGEVVVKPKNGAGPGDETGYNIRDF